jgi:endoglycosylceramidase
MRSLGVIALLVSSGAWASPLHVDGPFFRDAENAVVLLRGVNVAGNSKVPPFRPVADPSVLDPLPGWGMNVVRLLFNWEAYEPTPGQYDDSYLAYYTAAVEAADARGLYVVVDFHQDGFSRFTFRGCGEGFPKWAVPPEVTLASPDNGTACAGWGVMLATDPDLPKDWASFYGDENGVRTRYLALVTRVAGALASEHAVIGYDLLNEPMGDEATVLAALHEDGAAAVHAVDPSAIIFVSPSYLGSLGAPTTLPPPTFSPAAYSPHYYDASLYVAGGWDGADPGSVFSSMEATAAAWNVPLFLGEFGAPAMDTQIVPYLDAIYGQLDASLLGGAQWVFTPGWTEADKDGWNMEDFSIVDDHGATRANFTVRPFPRRIAGTPTHFAVERDVAVDLSWTHDPSAGTTEIFLAPAQVLGSAEIDMDASSDLQCTVDGDLVKCSAATAGDKSVHLTPAKRRCGLTGLEALLLAAVIRRVGRRRSGRHARR